MSDTPTYLALDIGEKRIGVAVGSIMPFGRGVLDATDESDALEQLAALIRTEGVKTIIVGVPEVKSGETTSSAARAKAWVELLQARFDLPVVTVNEAYSSIQAEQELRQAGVDTQQYKDKIDERAAELLLAQYLAEQA